MDGLDEHRHGGEFRWAIGTALSSFYENCCGLFDYTAEQFVEESYEFIAVSFQEEGLKPPTKARLVQAVRKRQREEAMDWIFDVMLEGGDKLHSQRVADEEWNEIRRQMRLARLEPPSRTSVDRYISRRLAPQ
jgi:hypothetical protein